MSANEEDGVMLGERKRDILRIIIDDYVSTGEPIGSRTIARKYNFGLSPATIRNEMSDLEEMGYLQQPHTSAGRIPSDKGYRLYVDELMNASTLDQQDLMSIREMLLDNYFTAIEQVVRHTTELLSVLTHYTTIAVTPSIKKNFIRNVQIIPIDNVNALLIIITGSGVIKNNLIKLPEPIEQEFLLRFSNILNEKLYGLTIESITFPIIQEIQSLMGKNRDILMPILDVISRNISNIEDDNVYFDGTLNILDYPEYSNIEKAKEFLDLIKCKQNIYDLLKNNSNESIKISIGRENYVDKIDDCSLVSTTYMIGDKILGTVGVIGPKRMNYPKVVSSMDIIRKHLDSIFDDWIFK